MREFTELKVVEKSRGDFRGYVICKHDGEIWELRGEWAPNPVDAAKNAYDYYLDNEWWHLYGCVIDTEV